MKIRKLNEGEKPPIDLLLLADPSEKIIKGYIGRGACFVAENDNRVVGVYVLLPTRPETVELVNVAVLPDQQGKGLGKALIGHAVRTAQEDGYKIIEVGTGNSGIGQLALYQKCGFRITGVDRDFFVKHYPEDIVENGIPCRDMIRLALDL
ncbi:GNAT family N-acetyltransferase [Domibacillus enclensis]|uniref:N-acetyltransferase n=1 Tax=Domibacillus enclensis TaxID=1017273 RepID=A0A1N7AGA6_9BACI|nr:GNAT family N-acetyltransferase [Domibacillus enclensis]OXS75814.1 N-acetyltransferase [Domibacillus enclensis]SIR38190.1 Predicted N-acetyltransferase YhbS [Domibacillus enclensis]